MRRNRHSVAHAELPTEYSLARTVLASLALSFAVVVGALLVMYPALSALVAALATVSWVVAAVALRLHLRRRPMRRLVMVRIPFTDLHIEV